MQQIVTLLNGKDILRIHFGGWRPYRFGSITLLTVPHVVSRGRGYPCHNPANDIQTCGTGGWKDYRHGGRTGINPVPTVDDVTTAGEVSKSLFVRSILL